MSERLFGARAGRRIPRFDGGSYSPSSPAVDRSFFRGLLFALPAALLVDAALAFFIWWIAR